MGGTGLQAVTYTARDGCEVSLDMRTVASYVLTGSGSVSDAELAVFLGTCRARGLNPLARDCYLVKYGSSPAATIVSKDYFLRVASARPTFDGYEAGLVLKVPGARDLVRAEGSLVPPGATLVGGWAAVYDKGVSHPFRDEVSLSEYSTGKSGWSRMPATMIRKVALVHALREAYPGDFGGLYGAEEMDQARDGAAPAEPVAARVGGGAEYAAVDCAPERPAALSEGERASLAALAEAVSEATGEVLADCKRSMVLACGSPVGGEGFEAYYGAASEWARYEAEMCGDLAQAEACGSEEVVA